MINKWNKRLHTPSLYISLYNCYRTVRHEKRCKYIPTPDSVSHASLSCNSCTNIYIGMGYAASCNPRRACARVTVVVLCVCLCVQASHPLLTQLQDQVDIPMDSVSCRMNLAFFV